MRMGMVLFLHACAGLFKRPDVTRFESRSRRDGALAFFRGRPMRSLSRR